MTIIYCLILLFYREQRLVMTSLRLRAIIGFMVLWLVVIVVLYTRSESSDSSADHIELARQLRQARLSIKTLAKRNDDLKNEAAQLR